MNKRTIYCECTPSELNSILIREGSRGRVRVKSEVALIKYTIGTEGKPIWYGYQACETCRLDNYGDYTPDNCVLISPKEHINNKDYR